MSIHWMKVVALAAGLAAGGVMIAQKSKPQTSTTTTQQTEEKGIGGRIKEALPKSEPVFTEHERVLIKDWFRVHGRKGLPPGLAKRDRLPPGLEKQLRERGTLPPGLQKKLHPLPIELERQLHRLPTGYKRVILGGNIILMEEKTAVIYDIIRDVIL
ncbi:MAG: hypothetical protein K6U09_01730 [Acidobacteriia bacterium]|nr:hypothetical protein [Terriglobia bacterium]